MTSGRKPHHAKRPHGFDARCGNREQPTLRPSPTRFNQAHQRQKQFSPGCPFRRIEYPRSSQVPDAFAHAGQSYTRATRHFQLSQFFNGNALPAVSDFRNKMLPVAPDKNRSRLQQPGGCVSRAAKTVTVVHQCFCETCSRSPAALPMPRATFSITSATCGTCPSASFHFFSSMYSRTAAMGFAPYPVYAPGA
jgi:hypothetical protein